MKSLRILVILVCSSLAEASFGNCSVVSTEQINVAKFQTKVTCGKNSTEKRDFAEDLALKAVSKKLGTQIIVEKHIENDALKETVRVITDNRLSIDRVQRVESFFLFDISVREEGSSGDYSSSGHKIRALQRELDQKVDATWQNAANIETPNSRHARFSEDDAVDAIREDIDVLVRRINHHLEVKSVNIKDSTRGRDVEFEVEIEHVDIESLLTNMKWKPLASDNRYKKYVVYPDRSVLSERDFSEALRSFGVYKAKIGNSLMVKGISIVPSSCLEAGRSAVCRSSKYSNSLTLSIANRWVGWGYRIDESTILSEISGNGVSLVYQ